MGNVDCVVRCLTHRGYGNEEGCWHFTEPLVLLGGRAQTTAVSHTLALCDALWGDCIPAISLGPARMVKLELDYGNRHIAINCSRRPGVGPGRRDLSIYVDHLRQMGNTRRLCALLDEILPWRRKLGAWVDYLWDRQPWGTNAAGFASNKGYAERLRERLAQVLAETNGLPLLLLQFPPIDQGWRDEYRRILDGRKGSTMAVFMDDVNQTVGDLLLAMKNKGGTAC